MTGIRQNKKLTKREKRFCVCFLSSGSCRDAARRAGYEGDCELVGEELICKSEITAELERLSAQREKSLASLAMQGYRRLAFGSVCDAVSLLYKSEPSDEELREMDFFGVSEIKRPKDGSMEIKFFDRLKALEKLGASSCADTGAKQLYDVIERSAGAVENFRYDD